MKLLVLLVALAIGRTAANIPGTFTLALDGSTGNPFVTQYTEGSSQLELLSFQHLARLISTNNAIVCSVNLTLSSTGPLNAPSVERIIPTKVILDNTGELVSTAGTIRYRKATQYSEADLLTILRNQEYFNFADEMTAGQRSVLWEIGDCNGDVLTTGTTVVNLNHVNDNAPVIELRSATVIVPLSA